MSDHPSYLALDRLALGADASADEACRAHVLGCGLCRRHVEALAARPALPERLRAVPRPKRWLGGFSLALGALASLAVFWVVARDADDIRTKGSATVAVFVKRGEEVFMWDNRSPLRTGDRVQLSIEPASMRFVYVRDGEGRPMYDGPLENGVTTLPLSWRVEGAGEAERLVVVLSRLPLSEEALRARPDAEDLVRFPIVLTKQ